MTAYLNIAFACILISSIELVNGSPFGPLFQQRMETPPDCPPLPMSVINSRLSFGTKSLFRFPTVIREEQVEIPLSSFQAFPPFPPMPVIPTFSPFPPFRPLTTGRGWNSRSENRRNCRKSLPNSGAVRRRTVNTRVSQRTQDNSWHLISAPIESSVEYVYEYELPMMEENRRGRPPPLPQPKPCISHPIPTQSPNSLAINPVPTEVSSTESEGQSTLIISSESTAYTTSTAPPEVETTSGTETPETTDNNIARAPEVPIALSRVTSTTRIPNKDLNLNISEYVSKNIDEEKLLRLFTFIFANRTDFLKALSASNNTNVDKLTEGLTSRPVPTEAVTTERVITSSKMPILVTIASMEETTTPSIPPLEPESVMRAVPSERPTLGPITPGIGITDNFIENEIK